MKKLTVRLERGIGVSEIVGVLVEAEGEVSFEYDAGFAGRGLELSPLKLPLRTGLVDHEDPAFGPLFGLFDDSLPDGWGLLLMDRHFRQAGLDVRKVGVLDRLAYLGRRTMGALTYLPMEGVEREASALDLEVLEKAAKKVLQGSEKEVLPELLRAGGSPGGARPKVLVGFNEEENEVLSGEDELPEGFEHWLVKFGSLADGTGVGRVEYAYSLMARAAGLLMCETRLFEGRKNAAWFGTRRFDRPGKNQRRHVHTFGNLIQSNFRIPSCDYDQFLQATLWLTRNHADVVRAFRWMVFNIAAHNRDDHVKNFAFMLDEADRWTLTPAYDLCFSEGIRGEHSMSVNGEGADPKREHVMTLAAKHGVKKGEAAEVIEEVNEAVGRWKEFAEEAGCLKKDGAEVGKRLREIG